MLVINTDRSKHAVRTETYTSFLGSLFDRILPC